MVWLYPPFGNGERPTLTCSQKSKPPFTTTRPEPVANTTSRFPPVPGEGPLPSVGVDLLTASVHLTPPPELSICHSLSAKKWRRACAVVAAASRGGDADGPGENVPWREARARNRPVAAPPPPAVRSGVDEGAAMIADRSSVEHIQRELSKKT